MDEKGIFLRKRNYGIDLLRIAAIGMILILHILGKDNVLSHAQPLSANYNVAWLMEIACYGAVNCYALVSGYVGVHAKHKYSNLFMLWLQVFFYSAGATLLFAVLKPDMVNRQMIFKSLFPVMTRQYWYFTSYFGLFLILPFLNAAISALSRKKLRVAILACIMVYSVIAVPFFKDPFQFNNGYSMFWLAVLYVLGAYFGKYGVLESLSKRKMLLVYISCVIFTWLTKLLIVRFDSQLPFFILNKNFLVSYMSPTILIGGIALLAVFANLNIPDSLGKGISYIGSLAFGVYIIHEQPLISQCFIKGKFAHLADASAVKMVMVVMAALVIIFTVCAVIDAFRQSLFKMLRLKQMVLLAESKITEYLTAKEWI